MPLDPRMRTAILQATQATGQSPSLGNKIIAWFEAMNSGNESITNRESVGRHMELFYSMVQEGEVADDDEEGDEE